MGFLKSVVVFLAVIALASLQSVSVAQSLTMNQLQKLAERGDAKAQNTLGNAYIGDAKAQNMPGNASMNATNLPTDYRKGFYWYYKAAQQGDPDGEANVGVLYYGGYGVQEDHPKAVYWFLKAANQESRFAQVMLAQIYVEGNGVPQDYMEAFFWYGVIAAEPVDPKYTEISSDGPAQRDSLADRLTPSQVITIQKRVRRWIESHRKQLGTAY